MVRLASRIRPAAAISSFIPAATVSQGGETRRFLFCPLALPLRQGRSQQAVAAPPTGCSRWRVVLLYDPPHTDKVSHSFDI
ncbi:MAG: hypothetical protein IPJ47_13460 [Anaerolineales bacterium]|nr:hypothetical protein [Anaerolineales bacterium]